MKTTTIIGAVLAVVKAIDGAGIPKDGSASGQSCQGGGLNEQGVYYCKQAKQITFQGVGYSDQYNAVDGMDVGTGNCHTTPKQFSGPLAPFDEPVRTCKKDRLIG